MKNSRALIIGSAWFVLLTLSTCATTDLIAVWKDAKHQTTVKRLLVIGVSERPFLRRFFEDEFVKQLKERGTDALQSYTIHPADTMLGKDTIMPKIKNMDIDAILITRLVDKKRIEKRFTEDRYVVPRSHYDGWHRRYVETYRYERTTHIVEGELVTLETNVYDAKSERLIWSALSETFVGDSDYKVMKAFITVMTKALYKEKVLT